MWSRRFVVVGFLASCVACGGEDEGKGEGGAGAVCFDGSNCSQGFFCFVPNNDPAGTCTELPAACGGKGSCDCLDEIDSQCATSTSCVGIVGEYAVACSQAGLYRSEGESCSQLIHCDSGFYCKIPGTGQAGTCIKNPEACAENLTCGENSCFAGICSGLSRCSVFGDKASILCK